MRLGCSQGCDERDSPVTLIEFNSPRNFGDGGMRTVISQGFGSGDGDCELAGVGVGAVRVARAGMAK